MLRGLLTNNKSKGTIEMKKFIRLLLASLIAISLLGCQSKEEKAQDLVIDYLQENGDYTYTNHSGTSNICVTIMPNEADTGLVLQYEKQDIDYDVLGVKDTTSDIEINVTATIVFGDAYAPIEGTSSSTMTWGYDTVAYSETASGEWNIGEYIVKADVPWTEYNCYGKSSGLLGGDGSLRNNAFSILSIVLDDFLQACVPDCTMSDLGFKNYTAS